MRDLILLPGYGFMSCLMNVHGYEWVHGLVWICLYRSARIAMDLFEYKCTDWYGFDCIWEHGLIWIGLYMCARFPTDLLGYLINSWLISRFLNNIPLARTEGLSSASFILARVPYINFISYDKIRGLLRVFDVKCLRLSLILYWWSFLK